MGLENLDIALYLNIAFYSVLGIGILIGFIKGFRRSLYTFIITIVFVGVFFLTVNAVVKSLYTLNLNFLGGLLANVSGDLSGVTSIKEAITVLLAQQLEGSLDASLSNPDFIEFVDAIGIFVLKIAYTIIYFTVIQFLYRFILFIVSLFIFRKGRAKNKNGKRTRWAGAIFGFLTAAVNVFVMIIVLSGIMSIGESLVSLQQTEELSYNVELNQLSRDNFSDLTMASNRLNVLNYQELAEENDSDLTNALNSLESIINEYNNNFIIKLTNSVKIEDEVTDEEKSLGIVLFDKVLSIQYKDTNIALRQDLRTFSQVAGIYLNSNFNESNDIANLTSTKVNNIFTTLSKSNLLISIIPIGVEVGADYFDVDLELDKETLYEDIVWQDEIQQIGAVASTGFMILESANAFDPDIDYKTVSLDGGDVEDLFDALSESKLVEYGAYLAVEPLLEQASTNIQSVITIPEDLNWKDEFIAFGDISSEILSSGITIADLESGDIQQILTIFSDVDLNVLLESKLTTRALVNILSGQTDINMDIDFLVIPDMPYDEWVEYDTLGNVIDGELMRILTSINILIDNVANIDFDDVQIDDLTTLSSNEIDNIFESRILVASLTEAIRGLSSDVLNLIIPDSVLDEDNYILKAEVKLLFNAITMAAGQLPCDPGDTECEDLGFDIDKILSLDSTNVDTLFDSQILFATTSNLIMEYGEDELVIPDDVKTTILVEEANLTIVNETEVKNAFLAISSLGLEDLNNIEVDVSILTNLAVAEVDDPDTTDIDESTTLDTSKSAKLFASKILHATISKFIIDEATPEPGVDATLIIPYYATEDYDLSDDDIVRIDDTVGNVEYISEAELTEVLEAVLSLDISDFSSIEDLDIALILDKSDEILDSAILHATISKQVIDLAADYDDIVVPNQDIDGIDIIQTDDLGEGAEFITKIELMNTFNALDLFGDIDDLDSFTGDIDLNIFYESQDPNYDSNQDDLLDSAIFHATISKQITDLEGTDLTIPEWDEYETYKLIESVNTTNYIIKTQIKAILNALDALEIYDFGTVTIDASILTNLAYEDDPDTSEDESTTLNTGKSDKIFASKIVHATISKVIFNATQADPGEEPDLVIPYYAREDYVELDYLGNPSDQVRITNTTSDEYITSLELTQLFEAILILDITDFNVVANFSLNDIIKNDDEILDSAILHATISKQVIDLAADNDDIVVPNQDIDGIDIIQTDDLGEGAEFITKIELMNTFNALDLLAGIDNLSGFTGAIDLNMFYESQDPEYDQNQKDLLDSSIMHATISEQILDLDNAGTIVVPNKSITESLVRYSIAGANAYNEYILKSEVKNLINGLDLLGANNIDDFDDNLDISGLVSGTDQDKVLDSATLHATFSRELIGLNNNVLFVPNYSEDGEIEANRIRVTPSTTEYVIKTEIKAILSSFIEMGYGDLSSFGVAIDTSKFFNNVDLYLQSSSIQATISNKILASTLLMPDKTEDGLTDIKIVQTDITYVLKSELEFMFAALEILGINDFVITNVSGNVTQLNSALATRQEQVDEKRDELQDILKSGIMHLTIDSFIQANGNISIPDLALDTLFGSTTDIIIDVSSTESQQEITNFIIASSILTESSNDDISNVSIDFNTIITLSTEDQDFVLDSMIVRDIITPTIELDFTYTLSPSDYENNDTNTFLTKQAIIDYLNS